MQIKNTYFLLFIIYQSSNLFSYPADSLMKNKDTNILEKCFIYPISLWQNISYRSSALDCQFAPSCSNFMAQAISDHGVIKGIVMGTDRLVRCNPFAYQNHLKHPNPKFSPHGHLKDPIFHHPLIVNPKNIQLAVGLSVVPGLGRIYSGKSFDGIFSFSLVTLFGVSSVNYYEQGLTNAGFLTGLVALMFWSADFYGAYRSTKYY